MLLHWIFTALAVIEATLICGFAPLSPWWGLPLAVGLYVATGAVFVVLLLIIAQLLPAKQPSKQRYAVYHWFIQHTLSWVMWLLGYRITLQGEALLPDRPFLLVSNHRSGFDPLVTLAAFRKWPLGFVSKPENFQIPVIGTAMKRACFLAIDRDNPRNAVTTIKQAAEQIHTLEMPMVIYPEGTRNKAGEWLLPFHAGSFKIAKLAKCPVVVMTTRYKRRRLLGKDVTLSIVDVMEETLVAESNTAYMSERAKEKMEENLSL